MSTEKLYLRDPLLLRFDARVLCRTQYAKRESLVLDRSAFFPEGGGQLPDQGVLKTVQGVLRVVDVQVDEEGTIHHLLGSSLEGELSGSSVEGEVDARRRREQRSQHTAQHLLSRALLDCAQAETVSARLGERESTIDLRAVALSEEQVLEAERRVQDVVDEDRPVRCLFPGPEELSRLPLRRAPKVLKDVRVIEIEGFDLSPCGGTHCTQTSQVGAVHVISVERYKGLFRLAFLSGRTAVEDYWSKERVLRGLAKELTCGALEVPAAVAAIKQEAACRQQEAHWLRERFAQRAAERWLNDNPPQASGTTWIVVSEPGADLVTLRVIAGTLSKRSDVVAVLGAKDATGDWQIVVERGSGAAVDAGAWLKQLAASVGGKGGGRPQRAEGRLPAKVTWSLAAFEEFINRRK